MWTGRQSEGSFSGENKKQGIYGGINAKETAKGIGLVATVIAVNPIVLFSFFCVEFYVVRICRTSV